MAAKLTEWDGNIDFTEEIGLFVPMRPFIGFAEEVDVETVTPYERGITEEVSLFIPMRPFIGFTDAEMQQGEIFKEVITSNTIAQFNSDSKYGIIDEESARLQTAYERTSVSGSIDSGYVERLDLTSEWRRVDNVDIKTTVEREVV